MAKLPRGCQPYLVVTGLTRYVAEHAECFGARELRTSAWAIASMSDARLHGGAESIEVAGTALGAIAKRAVQVIRPSCPCSHEIRTMSVLYELWVVLMSALHD